MIFNENNHLVGMARFHPVEGVASQVPFDPFTVCMAASLMAISQKLDAILETQAEILDFLRQKKKADLQGDLKILTEVLNSYQFNWNNEHYRMPALVQVQRIKRASEQSILLSRSQIQRAIQKRGLLTGDKEHRERLRELADLFGDYQLAVYLYSFSAFLEVLLLENFNASYIDSVLAYVESLSLEYRELYTESYDRLMQSASSSVQAQLRGGLAALTGTAGEMVAKIPIISRSQIDETLIDTGRRMGKAAKQKTTKAMEPFIARADSRVRPFLDQLKKIKRIYNENLDLLVDGENLYLRLE